jgi:hypothetical protein
MSRLEKLVRGHENQQGERNQPELEQSTRPRLRVLDNIEVSRERRRQERIPIVFPGRHRFPKATLCLIAKAVLGR